MKSLLCLVVPAGTQERAMPATFGIAALSIAGMARFLRRETCIVRCSRLR
jgi:hypothetical protein